MLILFQLLFLIFSASTVWSVVRRARNGALSGKSAIFWTLFWLTANIAVWRPNSTTILANRLGIGRGSDFVIYISLALIFYLLFRVHIKIEKVNREVTKVVRDRALTSGDSKFQDPNNKFQTNSNTQVSNNKF